MNSKYVDMTAVMQVIGCVFNNPRLLDYTDKYFINENDFNEQFHKIIFGTIYKLHEQGVKGISLNNICDFLSQRPKSEAVFKQQKGEEWILKVADISSEDTFDYYYNRLKKMSLLRAYEAHGVDVTFIYDPDNIMDIKKKQLQEDYIDNSTLLDLALKVENKLDEVRAEYVSDEFSETHQAGEGANELIDRLKNTPEVGIPMYGPLINTVTRGARLKKFYLRSAATGIGKTRALVADACYFACDWLYDEVFGWIKNGTKEPTLFIATEQDKEEVQTMMLAFLSNVNEEHILNGKYLGDEEDRVRRAAKILEESPLYIELMPDFSLQDVEDRIKKNIREHGIKQVCYDYLHSSMKILEEITKRSGGVKLREDNILFMLATRLKDLCNQYGIFIISSTQLNSGYLDSETPDQNLLRGAKSIADRIDFGSILLNVTSEDIEKLETILSLNTFEKPTIKMSIYKNRRGRYKGIYLWCKADLGTCRIQPMFATTYDYEVLSISDLKIVTEEPSAF